MQRTKHKKQVENSPAEIRQSFADILRPVNLRLIVTLPRFYVHHRNPRVKRPKVQIGYVRHLYRVVHHVHPGAAVPLLEHGLVDDEGCLDVLGGLPDVPLQS